MIWEKRYAAILDRGGGGGGGAFVTLCGPGVEAPQATSPQLSHIRGWKFDSPDCLLSTWTPRNAALV